MWERNCHYESCLLEEMKDESSVQNIDSLCRQTKFLSAFSYRIVQVWVGIIFFEVASMESCFGFALNTVDSFCYCFCYC